MFAQVLAAAAAATSLMIGPWSGADFQSTTHAQAKYRLAIHHPGATTVHLVADRVARGWLAAFCTAKVCSPMQVTVDLNATSDAVVQFELIKVDDAAATTTGATIRSDDGATITVKPSH